MHSQTAGIDRPLFPSHWPLILGIIAFLGLLLLNAWISDDAYITFRTVHNLVAGYGPVYNITDRVQTFTNPLWMLGVTGGYAITGRSLLHGHRILRVHWLGHSAGGSRQDSSFQT